MRSTAAADLRIINRAIDGQRWLAGADAAAAPAPTVEPLPSNSAPATGELGLRLAARGIAVDGLDLWPRPPAWPAERAWHSADLRTFDGYDRYSVVIGNLIFHQFSAPELAEVGAALRRSARVIVACEPARRRSSQALLAVLGPPLGANAVTQHDARVSVAAGFIGDELPQALGLDDGQWNFRCFSTVLGAYRMIAARRS